MPNVLRHSSSASACRFVSSMLSFAIKFFTRWVNIRLLVRLHSIRFICDIFLFACLRVLTRSISFLFKTVLFITWFECSRSVCVALTELFFDFLHVNCRLTIYKVVELIWPHVLWTPLRHRYTKDLLLLDVIIKFVKLLHHLLTEIFYQQ